jgi:hypothetical protein
MPSYFFMARYLSGCGCGGGPGGEQKVPNLAGFIEAAGPGIAPNPLFREVRSMDCEVTPPGAVVAPEVVVGVALWDTY